MITRLNHAKGLAAVALLALGAEQAAAMQFGGLFGRRSSNTEAEPADACDTARESTGRSVLGGVIGGIASRTTGSIGGIATYIPSAEFSDVLASAIACRLDPEEQEKAADATLEATRKGEVGSSATWQSETRDDVSGTSTITARNDSADGASCMNVTDVIIVSGEETTVEKRMCRGPGESRYTLVA